jgi:hypothetical protein
MPNLHTLAAAIREQMRKDRAADMHETPIAHTDLAALLDELETNQAQREDALEPLERIAAALDHFIGYLPRPARIETTARWLWTCPACSEANFETEAPALCRCRECDNVADTEAAAPSCLHFYRWNCPHCQKMEFTAKAPRGGQTSCPACLLPYFIAH